MKRNTGMAVRTVDHGQAEAALLEVSTRLRAAREAIADLMSMENARTENLHEDDDYIRRVIRSVDTKRRGLRKSHHAGEDAS